MVSTTIVSWTLSPIRARHQDLSSSGEDRNTASAHRNGRAWHRGLTLIQTTDAHIQVVELDGTDPSMSKAWEVSEHSIVCRACYLFPLPPCISWYRARCDAPKLRYGRVVVVLAHKCSFAVDLGGSMNVFQT